MKKKHLQRHRFVQSDEVKAESQEDLVKLRKMSTSGSFRNYTNAGTRASSFTITTLKVDFFRSYELFSVRYFTPCP